MVESNEFLEVSTSEEDPITAFVFVCDCIRSAGATDDIEEGSLL